MTNQKPPLLVCSCSDSLPVDTRRLEKTLGREIGQTYSHLCRSQVEAFSRSLGDRQPPTVCCTQEAPLFDELWAERHGDEAGRPTFVNIRERAGWSDEGGNATPKIAALIAEAELDIKPTQSITLVSEGRVLVLGGTDTAMAAAIRLCPHMDVSLIVDGATDDIAVPGMAEFPVYAGRVSGASGHLGAFAVQVEGLADREPSGRGGLSFGRGQDASLDADIILDLRGKQPLFPEPKTRDGYFNPDFKNPALVERALFDAREMVGEFSKPRYVAHDAKQCAHARSGIIACSRCIDSCPTGAITPAGEQVAIDPYICAGCGTCATVCPTGANAYLHPKAHDLLARGRTLLTTYFSAGGTAPVILVHEAEGGDEIIDWMARFGRGLPATVMPLAVNAITQVGLEIVLGLSAYGAEQVIVLANPAKLNEAGSLEPQLAYANAVLAGLGYGAGRISLFSEADPDAVARRLWNDRPTATLKAVDFVAEGGKRELLRVALGHLHRHAPAPTERVDLPEGAPFGAVNIDVAGCTLCLACTGACPTGALKSNPDKPQLRFQEAACVQCGLCRKICPENVIALKPGIDFSERAMRLRTLKEEEPFACISCGKPFGTKPSIDRMIEKLTGHAMFSDPAALERLKMCENCRVVALTASTSDPWAQSPRKGPRTTEDYLKEREALRQQARDAGAPFDDLKKDG